MFGETPKCTICEKEIKGGYIRDLYLGKTTTDRDIVVNEPENFAKKLAEIFDGTFIVLDDVNEIYRVVLPDKINYIDVTKPVGGSIEEDLKRRDFTINAIAYALKNDKYIDTTDGMKDLKNGVLRHYKDENFEDDPLRILRAFRFASTTGFKMDETLKCAINKYKQLLLNPARERINYEIMKLFGGGKCSETLLLMDAFGILEQLFPFVTEMKKVTPNTHHHLDLFHHVIETVRNIEKLYLNSMDEIKEHLVKIDFGGFPRINHLKLAGFLHDIGKFSTWTIEENGRHRFIKHDDVGAKMCKLFLQDLKFSKKQIEYISSMIKNHIYPSSVISAPDLNEKVMMRYIRKMENDVIDNIILAKADRLSARGEAITEEIIENNLCGLDKLLSFYFEKRDTLKPLPKLLDGMEIMQILDIPQSPKLGNIIKELQEAQLNGDIVTKEDAIDFVKSVK